MTNVKKIVFEKTRLAVVSSSDIEKDGHGRGKLLNRPLLLRRHINRFPLWFRIHLTSALSVYRPRFALLTHRQIHFFMERLCIVQIYYFLEMITICICLFIKLITYLVEPVVRSWGVWVSNPSSSAFFFSGCSTNIFCKQNINDFDEN